MAEKNRKQAFASPKIANAATKSQSDVDHLKQRIAQNFLLIWMDDKINPSSQACHNDLAQLRSVVNNVNIFTNADECVDFLTDIDDVKVFMIVEGTVAQRILPLIHEMPQLDNIFIFSGNKSRYEQWIIQWTKVKGVHTHITPICEELLLAVKQCNQDSIATSFIAVTEGASAQNLNQLEPSFMYTQIFKEILLEMVHDENSIKALVGYCRNLYNGNLRELNIIDEFGREYLPTKSIWWYTRECFIYQLLNRALRTLEGDTIINMGFFICDLHRQLELLHQQQIGGYHGKSFTVYRGQGLSIVDFEKLLKTKGGLMSFNNFLSTSKKRDVSLRFAEQGSKRTEMVGILFQMLIDRSTSSTPFATVREVSYYKTEEEVLFSMHTVFRIVEIKKMDNIHPLYQVDLELTADDDKQLRILTKRIGEETKGETGWRRLGQLLVKLNQVNKADELYRTLLDQTFDEGEKAFNYHQLGRIKNNQGDYKKALSFYEKSLGIWEKALPSNHPSLAGSYNNIGGVYFNMGEYSKAFSFCKKSLELQEKTLPLNHPSLATSYNNIGEMYTNMGEYSKALSFYEKSLRIREKILPLNHPNLATSYNNIGGLYDNMGEYSKALSLYEKSLAIREKTLLPNHPSLATSYNNIGGVYFNIGEYSKSISFYERALNIFRSSVSSNHPDIKTVQRNIDFIKKSCEELLFEE